MKKTHFLAALAFAIALLSFQKKHITVYMIGDSTMANKKPERRPETGWGMDFITLFDSTTTTVDNRALNGRSTKSFINEKRWQPISDSLQEGDYVFIEFGHNDEKIEQPKLGTSLEEYKTNLVFFVTETRKKNAIPVLLTPINRNSYDSLGNLKDTHGGYPDVVRSVAKEYQVPFIDMHAKTQRLLTVLGQEKSNKLFNHLAPHENNNFPKGVTDNTHLSIYGAHVIAALAVEGMKELHLPLLNRLAK